jgi:hypothetical protein
MKRKKLTIIFFSMMALAATPQAMHHFHNYVAAAQNRAQSELLQLLLSFSAPEAESRQAAPVAQPPVVCEKTEESIAPVNTNTARAASAPARTQSRVERPARKFEWKAEGFSKADQLALDQFVKSLETERRVIMFAPPQAPLALGAAQAAHLNSALRSARLSEKRAARVMQKEWITLSRVDSRAVRTHAPDVPMRTVKADVPSFVPAPETTDEDHSQRSSEESFR